MLSKNCINLKIDLLIMEKPICYIPESLEGYYKENIDNAFKDKKTAIKTILSIYLDYQCLPTEHNDHEPHDPNGLGILEMLCLTKINSYKNKII